MELTSENVERVVHDCLYSDPSLTEAPPDAILADGVVTQFGFDPAKLATHLDDITSMLGQLPKEFMVDGGGGASFLMAFQRADGQSWTDMHANIEALFCLGLATGKVQYSLPRDIWALLPGGVPYLTVDLNAPNVPAQALLKSIDMVTGKIIDPATRGKKEDAATAEATAAVGAVATGLGIEEVLNAAQTDEGNMEEEDTNSGEDTTQTDDAPEGDGGVAGGISDVDGGPYDSAPAEGYDSDPIDGGGDDLGDSTFGDD